MTKTYFDNEIVNIHSVIKIEFFGNKIIIEHQVDATDFNDDDSLIFLCFNPKESRKIFQYYKTDSVEDLIDHIHQHFTTYNSLKRYQNFFEKRDIHRHIHRLCSNRLINSNSFI
jgi:bisphosphoglycerate-independent phosphoglycerate mutase (AlkP superfamily)